MKMLQPSLRTMDTRSVKPPPKKGDAIYDDPEWRRLRDQVRREAGGRCQREGCPARGRYVDHIIEIKDGGPPLDRSNLELLCPSHHQIKTAAARAERARRVY